MFEVTVCSLYSSDLNNTLDSWSIKARILALIRCHLFIAAGHMRERISVLIWYFLFFIGSARLLMAWSAVALSILETDWYHFFETDTDIFNFFLQYLASFPYFIDHRYRYSKILLTDVFADILTNYLSIVALARHEKFC